MKIYFCDGCNESIPLADIQAGQVTTIKGKLFCRNCIPLGSGAAASAAPPAESRGTHPLVVLALLALIGYVVWRELPRLSGAAPGAGQEAAAEQADGSDHRLVLALQQDLNAWRAERDELQRDLSSQRSDLDAARGSAADLQRSADQMREQIDALQRSQASTGTLIEKLQKQENRMDALAARIDSLADLLNAQQQTLQAQPGPVAAAPAQAEAAAPGADPTQQAALEALKRGLQDKDAGRRFDAVDKVLKGRFKQLAPNLLPLLEDEDPFVRMRAMQALGDFNYADAVPALFEVIDDSSITVRKTAAEQLVRLTGYDPGFDARAGKPERDKAVKKWRDWVGSH
jgi:hypothetical protein